MRIGLISLAMIECQSDNQIVYDIKSWLGLKNDKQVTVSSLSWIADNYAIKKLWGHF